MWKYCFLPYGPIHTTHQICLNRYILLRIFRMCTKISSSWRSKCQHTKANTAFEKGKIQRMSRSERQCSQLVIKQPIHINETTNDIIILINFIIVMFLDLLFECVCERERMCLMLAARSFVCVLFVFVCVSVCLRRVWLCMSGEKHMPQKVKANAEDNWSNSRKVLPKLGMRTRWMERSNGERICLYALINMRIPRDTPNINMAVCVYKEIRISI